MLTLEDLRDLCIAHGLPGAEVREIDGWKYILTPGGCVTLQPDGEIHGRSGQDLAARLDDIRRTNEADAVRSRAELDGALRALGRTDGAEAWAVAAMQRCVDLECAGTSLVVAADAVVADLRSEREAHMHAVAEGNRLRRERDTLADAIWGGHAGSRLVTEAVRRILDERAVQAQLDALAARPARDSFESAKLTTGEFNEP